MTRDDRARALTELMPRLRRRARRYTHTMEAAEDLMQETLLRVWRRLAAEATIDELDRYVFTAMRNLARRPPPEFSALDPDDAPPVPPEAGLKLTTAEVLAAIAHLPPAQARLLMDHALAGATCRELAQRHGLPLGTVMSRLARGRARLRARLDLPEDKPVTALLDDVG